MIEKNIGKATWKSKISKNMSKERKKDNSLMLVTIRDDTWKLLNMQHIPSKSKRWDYSDTPSGGTGKN